jgi:opacity protein-like surface antigen
MKKLLFTVSFAMLASFTFSQTIIPKVGATLSNWGGDDIDGTDAKLGLTLGVGFNFPLATGPISLQPELNFAQKGWKASEGDASVKVTINYIEIPVLIKASFGEATKFYLNAGPSLAIGLGGKIKAKDGSMEESVKIKFGDVGEEDAMYIEKKTDIGLQMGAGVLVAEKVMIDVRYGLGLSSLYKDGTVKNNVIHFTVGFPLNLN